MFAVRVAASLLLLSSCCTALQNVDPDFIRAALEEALEKGAISENEYTDPFLSDEQRLKLADSRQTKDEQRSELADDEDTNKVADRQSTEDEQPLELGRFKLADGEYTNDTDQMLTNWDRYALREMAEDELSFKELKSIALFIGFGISGSSLVGALMDAHPRMVISNEANLARKVNDLEDGKELYRFVTGTAKQQADNRHGGGGYDYTVEGQWQGSVEEDAPYLIGDKMAEDTSNIEFGELKKRLKTIANMTELPLKLILVNRNPFDHIAGKSVKRMTNGHRSDLDGSEKGLQEQEYYDDIESGKSKVQAYKKQDKLIDEYIENAKRVQKLIDLLEADAYAFGQKAEVVIVEYDKLVRSPKHTLTTFFKQLDIEISEEYLTAAAAAVWPEYHYTRFDVQWDKDSICRFAKGVRGVPYTRYFVDDSNQSEALPSKKTKLDCALSFPGPSPCSDADFKSHCNLR